ncbi:MAG: thioredoxin domain-containing protein [Deltaproteobacteria bacterium]|nr:thioredoxin domain-containing protein [Deltaproteobacteria bacterium]
MTARLPVLVFLAIAAAGPCGCGNAPGPAVARPSPARLVLPGVDTGSLTPREHQSFSALVSDLGAPCPELAVSVAQCVATKQPCPSCLPAARFVLRQVRSGKPEREAAELFAARFSPESQRTIDLEGSPVLGPADAPVTIVEWADFQCPACAGIAPLLEDLLRRFSGKVRLVFKHYPLYGHAFAEPAARAAFAAADQGKFWPMHALLFAAERGLAQPELEGYAQQLGLDLGRFRQAMGSAEAAARLARDRAQGDSLGVGATPTLFINGREVPLSRFEDPLGEIDAWIELEIELAALPAAGGRAKETRP